MIQGFTRERNTDSVPIWPVSKAGFGSWLEQRDEVVRGWLDENGYRPERHKMLSVPSAAGRLAGVVLGLGDIESIIDARVWDFAGLPTQLPGRVFHLEADWAGEAATRAALGWALGSYRYRRYRRQASDDSYPTLVIPDGCNPDYLSRTAEASTLIRDLINTPAEDMGPAELAAEAEALARRFDARFEQIVGGELLRRNFPAIHSVGRASPREPRLILIEWGDPGARGVTLVGKGVCFDSGGLDIKTAQGMALMKKDMGGAAHVLGLAQMIMEAELPLHLRVLIPAVDNSIAGNAYRPGDVLETNKGITVEIGNTDAEGRMILCDALAYADAVGAELIIDLATLTGAARIALGPELPALYGTDQQLTDRLLDLSGSTDDPMWRMPLWPGYEQELASKVADVNHIGPTPMAGSVVAALFLKRFVTETPAWVHIDLFAWNAKDRPGRPVGAEAQSVRALYALLEERYG